MLKAGLLAGYVGIEPVKESFDYVVEKFGRSPGLSLLNQDWLSVPNETLGSIDYTFCIEVVEHLAEQDVLPFLKKLADVTTKNLFLSTPDKTTSSHGARTTEQWQSVLKEAGLQSVTISSQWTTLFVCQRFQNAD